MFTYPKTYEAVYEYNYYGKYTQTITYESRYRANSKANFEDAKTAIRKKSEKGISQSAKVLQSRLINEHF